VLSERSLTWLRAVHERGVDVGTAAADHAVGAIDRWHALDSMVHHVPAWREPFEMLAARDGTGLDWPNEFTAPACPQVVDVDFPRVALQRAEWVDGNLRLELAVPDPDPEARTTFRVVGAEPRLWDVEAPDRTFVDVRLSGVHVHMPLVNARVELVRGNY